MFTNKGHLRVRNNRYFYVKSIGITIYCIYANLYEYQHIFYKSSNVVESINVNQRFLSILSQSPCQTGLEPLGLQYKVEFTNSKIVLIVDLSLYLKTKKLLSVFPLFMTNMLSFLRTRLPTISCLYVNHITSNV